jgi:hypothetical protein
MKKYFLPFLIICCCVFTFAACDTTLESALGVEGNPNVPLAAPEIPSVVPGHEKLLIAFTTAATATGYQLWFGTEENTATAKQWTGAILIEGRKVSAEITGLTNGVTYYVWSKAVYSFGVSDFSECETGVPLPPPAAPAVPVLSSADTGQLDVSWTAVSGAESYLVYYSRNGGDEPSGTASSIEENATVALLTGLDNGVTYYVWIQAKNTAGVSSYSPSANAQTRTAVSAPAKPDKPKVMFGDTKLTVTWDAVKTSSSYLISYGTVDNSAVALQWSPEIAAVAGTVSVVITGLENETLYYVWVRAKNSAGISPYSDSAMEITHGKQAINFTNPYFVVGKAAAEFSPGGDRGWRKKETTVGNLMTDSIAWDMRRLYPDEHIDFVLIPARAVAAGHAKGDMTIGSLSALINGGSYNYDWSCSLITLTGAQVIDVFSAAADVTHDGGGGHGTGAFGLISHDVQHTIDYTTRGTSADAIKRGVTSELVINGEVLVHNLAPTKEAALLNKTYRLVTLQYLIDGLDDYVYYEVYQYGTNVVKDGVPIWKCMVNYVYDFDVPLVPALDGRIKLIGGVPIP